MEEKYEVVYPFKDLKDNNYIYKVSDVYPREELTPTKKRINELASEKNLIGKILIKKIENETEKVNETEKTEETEKEEKADETEKTEETEKEEKAENKTEE